MSSMFEMEMPYTVKKTMEDAVRAGAAQEGNYWKIRTVSACFEALAAPIWTQDVLLLKDELRNYAKALLEEVVGHEIRLPEAAEGVDIPVEE